MKIIHIITTINRGGAENHLIELVKGQLNQGHQVQVAYLKGDGYWTSHYEELGAMVTPLGLKHYGEIRPILRLRKLIQTFKPDIVHAHLASAELYTRLALFGISSQKLPWVISKHNDHIFYECLGHQMMGRWVSRRANRIIAISNAVKNYHCEYLRYVPDKVAVIYYGIEPKPYENIHSQTVQLMRQSWGVDNNTFIIGTVSRLISAKALDILLKGFAIYLQSASVPTKLLIVGSGPLELELKKLAEQLKIAEQVVWAGFRKDIPAVMNTLELFVLTSEREGLGQVLLEAMAAGKPIVATNVSAIPEVVEDKVTGLLVPPRHPDKLAQAFKFFEQSEARERFGFAGRLRVKSVFTLPRMIEQTLAVYGECLKDRGLK